MKAMAFLPRNAYITHMCVHMHISSCMGCVDLSMDPEVPREELLSLKDLVYYSSSVDVHEINSPSESWPGQMCV